MKMWKLKVLKISMMPTSPSNRKLFVYGAATGVTMLSIALASVPRMSHVTDDTAIYQQMSEIRIPRQPNPSFDQDISHLSQLESRYRERLPVASDPRVAVPMHRILKQKYRYPRRSK